MRNRVLKTKITSIGTCKSQWCQHVVKVFMKKTCITHTSIGLSSTNRQMRDLSVSSHFENVSVCPWSKMSPWSSAEYNRVSFMSATLPWS